MTTQQVMPHRGAYHYWMMIVARNRLLAQQAAEVNRPELEAQYDSHADNAARIAHELVDCMDLPMPSIDQVYAFLRDEYVNSRFEGRNAAWPTGVPEGGSYSELLARSKFDALAKTGMARLGPFESRRGRDVIFNRELRVVNPDAPPLEIQIKMRGDWS